MKRALHVTWLLNLQSCSFSIFKTSLLLIAGKIFCRLEIKSRPWLRLTLTPLRSLPIPITRCTRCSQIQSVVRAHLVRRRVADYATKQDVLGYRTPSQCGKVYIGETGRPTIKTQSSTTETSGSPVPRPPAFESKPATLNTPPPPCFALS